MESSLRLVMDAHGKGKVFLDGKELPRVYSVKVECEVGCLNRVTIETSAELIEVDGLVDVTTMADSSAVYAVRL
jgi:hypothetical protein